MKHWIVKFWLQKCRFLQKSTELMSMIVLPNVFLVIEGWIVVKISVRSNFNEIVKKFYQRSFWKSAKNDRKIAKNRYGSKLKVTNNHKKTKNQVDSLIFCDVLALPPITTCVAILAVLDIFSD